MLLVQAHEHQGSATQQAIRGEMYHQTLHHTILIPYLIVLHSQRLIRNLAELRRSAQDLPTYIPEEVINYVEDSRNPDIYTREMVELVMRYNQQLKGRSEAFASFRDILGQQMMVGIPEIKDDVQRVVEASGGRVE